MKTLYRILSSMKLSVYLLGASMILVFFGTLDQVHYGIHETQRLYFRSLVAFWNYPEQWLWGDYLKYIVLPIPGGYLIGPLLLANLLCAHFKYFRYKWRTVGIALIHGGIILLLVGQFITDLYQTDNSMWIDEGATTNYMESFREDELVIIDKSNPETDSVVSIPTRKLKEGAEIQHFSLPFKIRVIDYFKNSTITRSNVSRMPNPLIANQGIGVRMGLSAIEKRPTYKIDERNISAALVELLGPEGSMGTWLVSNVFTYDRFPPQSFEYEGKTYEVAMRFKRTYLPFTMTLVDFSHDRYVGTDIPMNFSSDVIVTDSDTGEQREVLIYMNHPLRYGGYTFFQASFAKGDTASMFQVVKNPGRLIPYISCIAVSIGLLYQFMWSLVKFTLKRRAAA